jgi:hypothetical protein
MSMGIKKAKAKNALAANQRNNQAIKTRSIIVNDCIKTNLHSHFVLLQKLLPVPHTPEQEKPDNECQ